MPSPKNLQRGIVPILAILVLAIITSSLAVVVTLVQQRQIFREKASGCDQTCLDNGGTTDQCCGQQAGCTSDADCGPGGTCKPDGTCVVPPPPGTCWDGSNSNPCPPAPPPPPPPPPSCLTNGSSCNPGDNCCNGQCINGTCQIPGCNDDCSVVACGHTNGCGHLCTEGSGCQTAGCKSNTDCSAGQVCQNGICVVPPPPPPPPPQPSPCAVGDCNTGGFFCEQDGGTCTGTKPNCSCTYPVKVSPSPQPTPEQTSTPPLPGDYQSWTCPGPNCDRCAGGIRDEGLGWWASGCRDWCSAGNCPRGQTAGQLTPCGGSFESVCGKPGETRCGADTGYKETTCRDGCLQGTGRSCQPTQLAQPIQPIPAPAPLVPPPPAQVNVPVPVSPATCSSCLATARDPYDCAEPCNLSSISKVGYDPNAFSLIKETVLPSDFKPYDPSDSELAKKYGNGSVEQTNCLLGGPGLGAKGGCEPEALYLRDSYGVERANKVIITEEAYKKTSGLGCGNLFELWGEKCKEAFQTYTVAGFKGKDTEGTNTLAGLGTAFVAGFAGGPGGVALFATADFLFSKTRLDEQESAKTLLEGRFGKGVIDIDTSSFSGSAATLAQTAGIDTSSLGSSDRVDTLYRAYNSLLTSPFIVKAVPPSFDPKEVTDVSEQARIIQEINKTLTPPPPRAGPMRVAKEQIRSWDEVVSLQNIRNGLIAYKNNALSSGYGLVYQEKNNDFKGELVTNLALDAATAGVGHFAGQALKGATRGAENAAVKDVVEELAEKRLAAATEGLSEADKLNAIKTLINDAKVKGGEVVLSSGKRLSADDVLLKTEIEENLLKASDIKGVTSSVDEKAAESLVKDAKDSAGISIDQLRGDALARRALKNVDTKTLVTGLEKTEADVAHVVEAAKPPVTEVSNPLERGLPANFNQLPPEEKINVLKKLEAERSPLQRLEALFGSREEELAARERRISEAQKGTNKAQTEIANRAWETGVNLLEQGSVSVRTALTLFPPAVGAVLAGCNTSDLLKNSSPCIFVGKITDFTQGVFNIIGNIGQPAPTPTPTPVGEIKRVSVVEASRILNERLPNCNPKDIAENTPRLSDTPGLIFVCTKERTWTSVECFPGQIIFDRNTGLPKMCNDFYKWQFIGGRTIIQKSIDAFREAEDYKKYLAGKYKNIEFVNKSGYWSRTTLIYAEQLLDQLDQSFFTDMQQKVAVEAWFTVGRPEITEKQTLYEDHDWYFSPQLGGAASGAVVQFSSKNQPFVLISDSPRFKRIILHELLHIKDDDPFGRLSSHNDKFLGALKSDTGLSPVLAQTPFSGLMPSVDQKIFAEKDVQRGYIVPLGYEYNQDARAPIHEVYARLGEMYFFNPETFKEDFPLLYDYYKNNVFGGREYLR